MRMPRHARTTVALAAAAAVLATGILLTANGGLGGQGIPARQEGGPGPEQPVLRVEVLKVMDAAPLYLAIKEGFFSQEGLRVEVSVGKGGGDNVAKLTAGSTDIAFASYTPFFVAQASGAADLRLVADGSSTPQRTQMIVAGPNSPVKNINDMTHKRVAITNRNTMSQFLVMVALEEQSVPRDGIEWIELPFDAMPDALLNGQVDAAYLTQPFLTTATQRGVQPIFDTAPEYGSSSSRSPLTGYGATADFVRRSPKTIAAFQKAMAKGVSLAQRDRTEVEQVIVENIRGISPDVVKLIDYLPLYGATLDANRIQKIPDMMLHFNALPRKMSAAEMIAPQLSQ